MNSVRRIHPTQPRQHFAVVPRCQRNASVVTKIDARESERGWGNPHLIVTILFALPVILAARAVLYLWSRKEIPAEYWKKYPIDAPDVAANIRKFVSAHWQPELRPSSDPEKFFHTYSALKGEVIFFGLRDAELMAFAENDALAKEELQSSLTHETIHLAQAGKPNASGLFPEERIFFLNRMDQYGINHQEMGLAGVDDLYLSFHMEKRAYEKAGTKRPAILWQAMWLSLKSNVAAFKEDYPNTARAIGFDGVTTFAGYLKWIAQYESITPEERNRWRQVFDTETEAQ